MASQHIVVDGKSVCGRVPLEKPATRACEACLARYEGTGRYRARAQAKKKAARFLETVREKHLGGKSLRRALAKLLGPAKDAPRTRLLVLEELRAAGFSARALPDFRQLELFR